MRCVKVQKIERDHLPGGQGIFRTAEGKGRHGQYNDAR